jgi:hypothetical protein
MVFHTDHRPFNRLAARDSQTTPKTSNDSSATSRHRVDKARPGHVIHFATSRLAGTPPGSRQAARRDRDLAARARDCVPPRAWRRRLLSSPTGAARVPDVAHSPIGRAARPPADVGAGRRIRRTSPPVTGGHALLRSGSRSDTSPRFGLPREAPSASRQLVIVPSVRGSRFPASSRGFSRGTR